MSARIQAIKSAPGKCKLRVAETETRDAIVADTGPRGTTIAYVAIGAEAWSPLLAAAPELAESADAFLRWFRVFIGRDAYNAIRSDELDNLKAALGRAGVTP